MKQSVEWCFFSARYLLLKEGINEVSGNFDRLDKLQNKINNKYKILWVIYFNILLCKGGCKKKSNFIREKVIYEGEGGRPLPAKKVFFFTKFRKYALRNLFYQNHVSTYVYCRP